MTRWKKKKRQKKKVCVIEIFFFLRNVEREYKKSDSIAHPINKTRNMKKQMLHQKNVEGGGNVEEREKGNPRKQ